MLWSLAVIPLQCRSCSHLSHLSYRLARILALHLFQLHLRCLFCSLLCFKHLLLWWRWQFFSRPRNPFIVSFISLICGINFDYFQNSCSSILLLSCDPIAFWLLLSSWLFFNKQFVNFLNIYWGKKQRNPPKDVPSVQRINSIIRCCWFFSFKCTSIKKLIGLFFFWELFGFGSSFFHISWHLIELHSLGFFSLLVLS